MSDSQALTVKLSPESRDFIRRKVDGGDYASENDVVNEGLDTLRWETEQRERWETEVFMPTYRRMMADPASAISSEELHASLDEARKLRRKAG